MLGTASRRLEHDVLGLESLVDGPKFGGELLIEPLSDTLHHQRDRLIERVNGGSVRRLIKGSRRRGQTRPRSHETDGDGNNKHCPTRSGPMTMTHTNAPASVNGS
jgi:hypothetical protein